jgi:hypothetical protein
LPGRFTLKIGAFLASALGCQHLLLLFVNALVIYDKQGLKANNHQAGHALVRAWLFTLTEKVQPCRKGIAKEILLFARTLRDVLKFRSLTTINSSAEPLSPRGYILSK